MFPLWLIIVITICSILESSRGKDMDLRAYEKYIKRSITIPPLISCNESYLLCLPQQERRDPSQDTHHCNTKSTNPLGNNNNMSVYITLITREYQHKQCHTKTSSSKGSQQWEAQTIETNEHTQTVTTSEHSQLSSKEYSYTPRKKTFTNTPKEI